MRRWVLASLADVVRAVASFLAAMLCAAAVGAAIGHFVRDQAFTGANLGGRAGRHALRIHACVEPWHLPRELPAAPWQGA